jgi:hypothetical protein
VFQDPGAAVNAFAVFSMPVCGDLGRMPGWMPPRPATPGRLEADAAVPGRQIHRGQPSS